MQPQRSAKTAFGAIIAVAAIFACQDVTAPNRDRRTPPGPVALLNNVGNVVVSPDSMRGWAFYDDQAGVPCSGVTCALVSGPATPPLGTGSAQLSTASASSGNALILADYAGTRLDQITALRYSTYRESVDDRNNLAIALQLNVDYDLTDQNTGYQGRLVFEPYQAASGKVLGGLWQPWDATAGKWWGTKAAVSVGNLTVANPCVQATPCSWAAILARFPNVGVHAVYGAVVLKAGSGWSSFSGNVDSLAIGVNGVSTVFDFEAFTGPAAVALRAKIGSGVTGSQFPADSSYSFGDRVDYSFAASPGHEAPTVIIDDTLALDSGTIVMNQPHTIEVLSDSVFSVEGLSGDGRGLAQRFAALLEASDKAAAYGDIMQFFVDRLDAGTDVETLSEENARAWELTIDQARDSAALAAVGDALEGYSFRVNTAEPNAHYVTWNAPAVGASSAASLSAQLRAGGSARSQSATAARSVLAPDLEESPHESTLVLYVNGVSTQPPVPGEASGVLLTPALIRKLLDGQPRFNNGYTDVDYVYNRTAWVQLAEYDRANPCVAPTARRILYHLALPALVRFAACKGVRFEKSFTTNDYIEAFTARLQLIAHLTATNPDVPEIALRAKLARDSTKHVIFVGHSEGTVLIGQAIRSMPSLEGHPIQVAPSCVAALALASPGDRDAYDLSDHYKSGFIVRGDVILRTAGTGWDILDTPASARAQDSISRASDAGRDTLGALIASIKYEVPRV